MKKNIKIYEKGKVVNKQINYIPIRYIVAIIITILEILLIVAIMFLLAMHVPYFYIAIIITEVVVVIQIIGSNENPDYKIPWLLFVIILPIVGFMLYFIFHQRKLPTKIQKRLKRYSDSLNYDDSFLKEKLHNDDELIYSQAKQLCKIANTHLYQNTNLKYFDIGEKMHINMLEDLKQAREFVFLEFFIIEEGKFWDSILDILIKKVQEGLEIKLVYDDIGCMGTLPGNYYKKLSKLGILSVPFSKLKGQADGEFNNRSHRKILVIDGKVAYTGGVNIADEYINKIERFGHWKDTGIRLEGEAVNELTKLFLTDYYINIREEKNINFLKYYKKHNIKNEGYLIPFGDGPCPIYEKNIGKTTIMNILNHAKKYVYITTPYLIIDNELMKAIENCSLRGIDVRIIVPHIPDKKLVFEMTKSNYQLLIDSNVKIYEYEPGFIHSKYYISDDTVGMIGTINLDYRSLTHHFENGIWIYNDNIIDDIKKDFLNTQNKSIFMNEIRIKNNLFRKIIRSIVRIFSPLL